MNEQPPPPPTSLFSQLIIMLSSSAMQQLGMVTTPDGSAPPTDVEAAQGMIDILCELQIKTEGNLDEAEGALLGEAVTTLQMLFVQVTGGQGAPTAPFPEAPAAPAEEPTAAPAHEPAPKAAPEPEAASDAPADEKPSGDEEDDTKVRFKKSYG